MRSPGCIWRQVTRIRLDGDGGLQYDKLYIRSGGIDALGCQLESC